MPKAQRKKAHSLSGWEPSTEGVLSTGKKGIIGAGNCQQRAGPGRRTAAALPTNTIAKNAMAAVIHLARQESGLTQVELADFSGLSKPYVSGLERGNINASVYALVRIAEVLKITPSELMARVEKEIKKGPQKPTKETGRPRK